jgi:micrococcal nuclease
MKRTFVLLILAATLLAACGSGGGGDAQATAALQTAVAGLLTEQAPAPDAGGEATAEPAPADGAAATSVVPQSGEIPPLPAEATCVPLGTERVFATVVQVVNGDSAFVQINGQDFEVRYIGIDAPEGDEPGAAEALAANQALVAGKTVALVRDVTDVDEYGRLLRYVMVDDAFVNLRLLQQHVVFVSIEEPDTACERLFSSQ